MPDNEQLPNPAYPLFLDAARAAREEGNPDGQISDRKKLELMGSMGLGLEETNELATLAVMETAMQDSPDTKTPGETDHA